MLQSRIYPALLPPPLGIDALTRTEMEIFKRSDLSDKQIAAAMNISYYTVTTHMQNIRRKTGLSGKNEMNRVYSRLFQIYYNDGVN